MQVSEAVIIKGVREGLLLILDDDVSFSQILTALVERIKAQPHFFKGAPVTINAGHRVIDRPEFDVLYRMLTRNEMKVQTFVSLSAQSRMVAESYGVASRPPSFAAGDAGVQIGLKGRGALATSPLGPDMVSNGMAEAGSGLFLRRNLDPGQSLRYGGDVCILGDVAAGAEIIADGDVVVWGVLRGYVHAGMVGDDEAVVCALQMVPSQLGIAGLVSRFPNSDAPPRPELARLVSGRIVVEAWQADSSS